LRAMHHGIVGLNIIARNLRRYCAISVERAAARNASWDSGSTLINIIAQLPVSNNIAELPGLAREVLVQVATLPPF